MAWKSDSHKKQLQSSLLAQIHEDFVQYVILVPNPTFLEQLRDAAPVMLVSYACTPRRGERAEIPSGSFMFTE